MDLENHKLSALDYEERFYEEHKAAGLDYLGHGYWHESYALMVTEATAQHTYAEPSFFDAGCACGSILKGFKSTGVYKSVVGMDLSRHMTELGKKHFEFSEEEIRQGSITQTGLPDNSISLWHSAQVLEHIDASLMPSVVAEAWRITRPGGRIFLCVDAIKRGQEKSLYMGDPTHINIQPFSYWEELFMRFGFKPDFLSFESFCRSERGPTQGIDRSFFDEYVNWSVTTWVKPSF